MSRAWGPSFLRFRAVSRRRLSAVSRGGAACCYQRWRGASGAGADSVMSVGFSSSAIFDQFCLWIAGSWSCQLSALNLSLSRALDRWELDPSNLFPEPALLLRRDRYKTKWQRLPPAEPARKAGRRLEPCIGPAVQHLLLDGCEESSEPKLWSKEEVRIAEHWWSPDWNRRVNMIPL